MATKQARLTMKTTKRRLPARQLEANDGEVEKRKRDKTWNDVAAAQKRGVESQGLSKRTRHQLVSTEKVSCGLARAELG